MTCPSFTRYRALATALTLAGAPVASLLGQSGSCDVSKSMQSCYSQLASARAVQAVEARTEKKPTGSEATIPGSETAIKDFLPRFATALSIPGLSTTPKAAGLRFNIKPNDPVWRVPGTIQFEGVANEPKLYAPLVANVPQKIRSAVADSVSKTLSDLADASVSLAFNLENEWWGRSLKLSEAEISDVMGSLFTQSARQINTFQLALDRVLSGLTPADKSCAGAMVAMALSCFSETDRADVIDALQSLNRTVADVDAAIVSTSRKLHLDRLEDLVNSQPQLNLTAQAHVRDHLAGPSEQKGTLRFEWSPVSLDAARSFCNGKLAAECLRRYLEQDGILAALDRGHRFWFTTDFSNVGRYAFALPSDSASVTRAQSFALEPAVGYGSYLGVADQRVRLDFELRYRHSYDESVRENRWVSTATFTQKVNDQSNAIFTLKWANKPEFLGEVDKAWRGNIGYSYKVSGIPKE